MTSPETLILIPPFCLVVPCPLFFMMFFMDKGKSQYLSVQDVFYRRLTLFLQKNWLLGFFIIAGFIGGKDGWSLVSRDITGYSIHLLYCRVS